jgi:hypothetical protein
MGKLTEQIILKRSTNGQWIHEEILNILFIKGCMSKWHWHFTSLKSEWLWSITHTTKNADEDEGKKELVYVLAEYKFMQPWRKVVGDSAKN